MSESFSLDFKVRDYECDLQGIVNNSVYQNYLEHARHEFLLSRNISFTEFAKRGINLVVTRVELDYKHPLRSGDKFYVTVDVDRVSRIRAVFTQTIFHAADQRRVLVGKAYWAVVNEQGRPCFPAELEVLFTPSSAR